MQNSCREAYGIYTQYNSINKNNSEKVFLIIKVLEPHQNKEFPISTATLQLIVLYIEKNIKDEKLTASQKGRIIENFSRIKIIPYSTTIAKIEIYIKRLINAVMDD